MFIAIFHLLVLTCELVPIATVDPFSLNLFYLVVVILTVVFGHWRGLFLIISSVVHIYSMTNAIRNGADRKLIWKNQMLFGFILWIIGMFREAFLNEWSTPMSLAHGATLSEAIVNNWQWIYLIEGIEDVAWAILVTSTIFYFLTAKNGVEKVTRNIAIFIILAVIIVFISPYVKQASIAIYGIDPAYTDPKNWPVTGWWDYIFRLVIYPWIGYNSPLFPMLGYSFVGVAFGLSLNRPIIPKHFLRNSVLIGLGLVILGIIWLLFVEGIPADIGMLINFMRHPVWFVLFSTGLQLMVIVLILRLIEFNPKIQLEKTLKWTRGGRRWSIVALTVYSFLCIEYLIRLVMGLIFTQFNWMLDTQLPFSWTIFLIVIDVLVWSLILFIWEKIRFVGSLEWFLTKIAKRNKPGKIINVKDVLDVKGVLQEPEPVLFVQPKYEQKVKFIILGQSPVK